MPSSEKKQPPSLEETIARRGNVERRIMAAVAHLPVEQQLSTVMSWVSIDDLENAAITICYDPDAL
jgi:hypothetical protein